VPGIIAGALIAHPPILLPEVGSEASTQVAATVAAIRRLDAVLAGHAADLVVLCSPHSPAGSVAIPVRGGKVAAGDLSRFRAPQVRVAVALDEAVTHRLFEAAIEAGFPMVWAEDEPLDHGVVVPLHFLERTRANKPFVLLGLAGWSLDDFVRFGRWLHRHLEDRSVIFIASGDLSHRLIPGAPAGYRPDGQVFDRAVIDALRSSGVNAPVIVGGIIPEGDVAMLKRAGVAAVYTPKDFDITRIMRDIVELLDADRSPASANGSSANGA